MKKNLILILISIVITSCGGGSENSTPSSAQQTLEESTNPLDIAITEDDSFVVTGIAETGFNPLNPQVKFSLKGAEFSPDDISITINGVALPSSSITFAKSEISANPLLIDGSNVVVLKAYDSIGRSIHHTQTVWAGGNDLTINVLDGNGTPLSLPATLRVKLSDDDKVLVNATASHGNVVIHNVPSRTVVIEGSTESNLAGAAGGLGNSGSIAIKMLGFGTASTVENNDFSQGTNGWTFGTSPATVVPHAETVGPTDQLVPPSAAKVQMKQLASIVTNNDLELSTSGEGAQSMSRTFTTKPGTTSVVVRYRFVTSEVPGGFFGSEYNDYFSVIIRSSTSAASEAKTMNSLGLTAFDAGGSTGWRTLSINTNPQGDQIQVDATVANVGDGAYQSQVLIDFVEETRDKVKPTLTWNSNAGGISLGYSVQESALESPVTIDVYWARGNNYGSRIGNPIFSFTVPAGTAVGTGGPIPVKGNLLADDPSGATHLIATSSETMIAVLGDVQVSYGPNANAAVVNAGLLDVIKDSLRAAGQPKATITSTARSAADQARAMFNNLINTDHSIAANTATQLELYKAPGRAVVNVFTEKTKGMTLAQILEAKSMIRDAMEAEIVSQGPSSVSSHCADPAKRSTVDVGMNAFNLTNGPLFVSAATPRVSKLLNEPKNKAYHLELEVK